MLGVGERVTKIAQRGIFRVKKALKGLLIFDNLLYENQPRTRQQTVPRQELQTSQPIIFEWFGYLTKHYTNYT
jgi:hypothetical protein